MIFSGLFRGTHSQRDGPNLKPSHLQTSWASFSKMTQRPFRDERRKKKSIRHTPPQLSHKVHVVTYCTLFPIQWCSRGRGWKAQCQQEEYKPAAPGHSESQTPTAWSGQYRYCKGDRKFQGECCADKQFKILPQSQNTGGQRHQAERTRAKSAFVFSLKILFNGNSYHPNLSGCIFTVGR